MRKPDSDVENVLPNYHLHQYYFEILKNTIKHIATQLTKLIYKRLLGGVVSACKMDAEK